MSAHPTGQAAHPALNLWEAALQDLEPEEKDIISKHTQDTKPVDVLQIVEKRGQDTWNNRISFKRKSGEVVFLHDIFAKVARWVKKFVEVGDAAVQYDPAHAALPWAAVRFILQASINDIQRQAAVLEIVEDVARAIPLGVIHEFLYLTGTSAATESLKASLIKLYTLCWSSLAKALCHHDQSRMKRVLKNVLDSESDLNALSERIANQWTLVERSATLVQSEGLISHITKSQNRNEELLRVMNDIKMPVARIETYVEETQDSLDEMKRDRILDSISTIPYPQHHAKVSRNVLPGTGKWLLDHQVVKNWFSSSASEILWLHGIPGSGKSCLVSVILEKLIEESTHCPSSHPVYFYCTRNPAEKERADPTDILRSILRQLSSPRTTKTLPRSVMDKFDKERGSFFDLGDTLDLIIDIIKSRTITFIVLDALDECDTSLRFELIDALETILRESQSLVKIFVSSRNDSDLVCWLRDYPNKEILSSDNQVDLAAFVDDEVDRRVDGKPRRLLRARKISDALRNDIKQILKAQAQGMFRWAELQLQYLCKLLTEEDIRQRLGALPKDLTGIYHDIYQRNMSDLRDIDPQYEADAKKVFHLMLSSGEPWNPVDMANMLEPAPNAALRQPEKVFGLTFHLITHDKEMNVLRFAHLSVREYFETSISEFSPFKSIEANVEACLDYLKQTCELGFRPVSYPSVNWLLNVRKLATGVISARLAEILVEFLVRDVRTLESWLKEVTEERKLIFLDHGGFLPLYPESLVSDDATMVFVACALDLADILSRLVEAKPSSVHARNLEGQSTLEVACSWTQNANIVLLLLRKGVAVNRLVGHGQNISALQAAIFYGDRPIAVVRELLENGADPNCFHDGSSALDRAVSRNNTEAVELLLTYGANPNLTSPLNDPLKAAVAVGNEEIVTKLLSFGADVNALDRQRAAGKDVSALFSAIEWDKNHIAQLLLSHGADPIPRNERERINFERLLSNGDVELAKSLLFAPNQDRGVATMIQAARLFTEANFMTQLEVLLVRKPNEEELCEVMELAAKRSFSKVFKRLVEHAYGRSLLFNSAAQALVGTARRGQTDMFKTLWAYLINEKPTQNAADGPASSGVSDSNDFIISLHAAVPEDGLRTFFSYLLHEAAAGGANDIFQFILTEGSNTTINRTERLDGSPKSAIVPNAPSISTTGKHQPTTSEIQNHGAWYLQAAVKAGKADMLESLLRLGADPNAIAPDCDGKNAILSALFMRKGSEIIDLLLKSGADVNARMWVGRNMGRRCVTAMEVALLDKGQTETTSSRVIELLLEHGADPNAASDRYGSILQLAASKRHMSATELLLAHGADVNKGGGFCGSPLIAAVASAHSNITGTELIELLLKNGADINAQHPGEYETAFRAALLRPGYDPINQQIFQLLLAHNADMSKTGRDGTQALYLACASGFCDELILKYFLSHGADINASGGRYGNALQATCVACCPSEIVELLIAKGADVNAKGGEFGNALQAASHAGLLRLVEILLANGADVHANGGKYGHALQAAAISSNPVPIVKLLLSHGANINAVGGEYGTALQAACAHQEWSKQNIAMSLLISRGADLNLRGGKYGYALICAVAKSCLHPEDMIEVINRLLDDGADINCSHEEHGNALYAACKQSSESLMVMLIKRGISVTQLAGEHEHALFVACLEDEWGRTRDWRARALLDNGVNVNIRGKRYSCALEVAIRAENLAAAKLLVERGADVRVETSNDGSLLDIAVRSSSSEMVDLLRANGA